MFLVKRKKEDFPDAVNVTTVLGPKGSTTASFTPK
jgi:hypothetical protein